MIFTAAAQNATINIRRRMDEPPGREAQMMTVFLSQLPIVIGSSCTVEFTTVHFSVRVMRTTVMGIESTRS